MSLPTEKHFKSPLGDSFLFIQGKKDVVVCPKASREAFELLDSLQEDKHESKTSQPISISSVVSTRDSRIQTLKKRDFVSFPEASHSLLFEKEWLCISATIAKNDKY
eukprot:gnl/Carplike_NY0171/17412_a26734_110.p1 GENE.gnl/Carplike_NY0171/17412_a26734_110~~gnl/Carplike_NY0171/17412_a26734_110.p1  ORF type:complete len:107 (+),score=22.86 gnl/Carplike_NY0171/17412_a26734_110:214-534(+)